MYPVLFRVGGFEVLSYSAFAFLAMLGAMVVACLEARRFEWDVGDFARHAVATTIVGFIGAHILYAMTQLGVVSTAGWGEWFGIFIDFRYGAVWYGGFLLSTVHCYWYARKHRLPVLKMLDVAGLSVLVAQLVGRLGCILNGCCYGKPTTLPWGLLMNTPEYGHMTVHPAPLYEAIYLAVLFSIMWKSRLGVRDGVSAYRYFLFAPLGRFVIEMFFRGDTIRGFVFGPFSTSAVIAIALMVVGIILRQKVRQQ